jgi:hypothetical protein
MDNLVNKCFSRLTVFLIVGIISASCATRHTLHNVAKIGNVRLTNNIVASMPISIPCKPLNDGGCLYNFKAIFTDTQGVSTTIERLKRVYIDTKGKQWTSRGENKKGFRWNTHIKGGETATYKSWVRCPKDSDLRGGFVVIIFSGHDENGRNFSGAVSSKLMEQ